MIHNNSQPVRSFRIEKNIIKELQKIAYFEHTSINALVNSILKEYVRYSYGVKKMDGIIIMGEIFGEIINSIEVEKLIPIARKVGEKIFTLYNLAEEIFNNPLSFCEHLRNAFCRFANWASYSEFRDKGKIVINLHHHRGIKWSIFLKNFIEGGFTLLKEDKKFDNIEITCYNNMVIITILYIEANNRNLQTKIRQL